MIKNSKSTGIIVISTILLTVLVAVIAIGFFLPQPEEVIQGEAETSQYRVSSKVPSRVLEIRVEEGARVRKGDTLAIMDSPEVQAKLSQAEAAEDATFVPWEFKEFVDELKVEFDEFLKKH